MLIEWWIISFVARNNNWPSDSNCANFREVYDKLSQWYQRKRYSRTFELTLSPPPFYPLHSPLYPLPLSLPARFACSRERWYLLTCYLFLSSPGPGFFGQIGYLRVTCVHQSPRAGHDCYGVYLHSTKFQVCYAVFPWGWGGWGIRLGFYTVSQCRVRWLAVMRG